MLRQVWNRLQNKNDNLQFILLPCGPSVAEDVIGVLRCRFYVLSFTSIFTQNQFYCNVKWSTVTNQVQFPIFCLDDITIITDCPIINHGQGVLMIYQLYASSFTLCETPLQKWVATRIYLQKQLGSMVNTNV